MLKPGYPFGRELYQKNRTHRPLALDAVSVLESGHRIDVAHPELEPGRIEYVHQVRTGSICTIDTVSLIAKDRNGTAFEAHEYCCPFGVDLA